MKSGPLPNDRRRSDRINIVLPIQVRGTGAKGVRFEEFTKTLEVGRNGAKFGSKLKLRPNQKIHIVNLRLDTKAPFRVVGKVPGPCTGETFWGAESMGLPFNFWGINFPPLQERQEATATILLQCGKCKTQSVSYLSDLEVEVLDLTQKVVRRCKVCRRWTRWHMPAPGTEGTTTASVPPDQVGDLRRHRRLSFKIVGCLQTHDGELEMVKTVNISVGGLAVRSKKEYLKDVLVKVAFPYQPGGVNIFVLGRIVKVSTTEEPGTFLYGIQYLF